MKTNFKKNIAKGSHFHILIIYFIDRKGNA